MTWRLAAPRVIRSFLAFGSLLLSIPLALADRSPDVPTRFKSTLRGSWQRVVARVELKGTMVHYDSEDMPRPIRIRPSRKQWREFRRALDEINVWDWPTEWSSEGTDSGGFALYIEYPDRAMHPKSPNRGDKEEAHDANCSPAAADGLTRFRAAVQRLLGGRPFGPRVTPLQFSPLSQLQLVKTHSSPYKRNQWAEFLAPDGKVYRVWRDLSDCCHTPLNRAVSLGTSNGTLRAVHDASVVITEVCRDSQGEWFERETVLEKSRTP